MTFHNCILLLFRLFINLTPFIPLSFKVAKPQIPRYNESREAIKMARARKQIISGMKPLMERKNPFSPDMPVSPDLFAGRAPEISQISTALNDAIKGTPRHLLTQGERWIGKTSIARYAEALAQMRGVYPGDNRASFYVSFCSLGSCSSIDDLCLNIIDSYKRLQNTAKEKVFRLLDSIQGLQIGPVGITLNRDPQKAQFRVSEFPRIMENILRHAGEYYQAFLIIMDETERAARIPGVASMLKDTFEHLDRAGIRNMVTIVTATQECVDAFTSDHPSFPRLFRYVNLRLMDKDESKELINKALNAGWPPTKMVKKAYDFIHHYSDGFPGLVQELAYSAFEVNTDGTISVEDVIRGVLGWRGHKGALDTIFDKHFRKTLMRDLLSDRYRQILEAVDEYGDEEFAYKTIIDKLGTNCTWQVGSYVGILVQRGVLQRVAGRKGMYRFSSRMLPLWIRLHGIKKAHAR
jgi:hypothetical protein